MALTSSLRYSFRSLRQQPGLSLIAVVALTLGVGLTTMMFSIIQGAFLRGLPFEDADRIAAIGAPNGREAGRIEQSIYQHDFVDWSASQQSLEMFSAFYSGTINVSEAGNRPERFDGAFITPSAFDVVGARAQYGRVFQPQDAIAGAPKVVLLSHEVFVNRYQANPAVVGRAIRVNGQPATVAGVMPEGFAFPNSAQVWVPLVLDPIASAKDAAQPVMAFGRLREGVSFEQATAEFAGLARRQAEVYPETNKDRSALVQPFIRNFLDKEVFSLLFTMLGAVFGVLLIACANVANLLIARTAVRMREIAIRTAIGASRSDIVKQLLTDAFVLASAGTAFGLVLAHGGITMFNRAIVDTNPPFWIDIRLDLTVLLFTAGLALVATIASGLLPALQASRGDINETLKDESRGSSGLRVGRMSRALVVAEIAVSCGLLVASGLAIKSIVNLKTVDYGFATDDVFTARMGLFEADYPDAAARARFVTDVRARLLTAPGVQSAALAANLPASGAGRPAFALEGAKYATDEEYPSAARTAVSPGFFDTFGRRLLRGRDFSDADTLDAPRVVIVNEGFAQKYFGAADPLGRRIRLGRAADAPWATVIAVAPNMYLGNLQNTLPEGMYVALAQEPSQFLSIAARGPIDAMQLASPVRDAVAAVDGDLPLYWLRTMAQSIAENNWHFSVFGSLFSAFGAAALFLATVGLYGVIAFSVSRRTQEIGVRMALGADRGRVLRMVMRQGLWQVGIGLVLGLGLAALLAQLLTVLMFGVEPFDIPVFGTVALSLLGVAMLACFIPARRAMQVSPTTALRGSN